MFVASPSPRFDQKASGLTREANWQRRALAPMLFAGCVRRKMRMTRLKLQGDSILEESVEHCAVLTRKLF
jgi:hypothetical protein